MRTGAHIQLCVRLWVALPVSITQRRVRTSSTWAWECSVCSNGLGTLMCSTPHSTNTVSGEQPWSNVCNGELGSLCSYARKACIFSLSIPRSLSLWLPTLKCHEKLQSFCARKASLSSFSSTLFMSLPLYLLCLLAAFQPRQRHGSRDDGNVCLSVGPKTEISQQLLDRQLSNLVETLVFLSR